MEPSLKEKINYLREQLVIGIRLENRFLAQRSLLIDRLYEYTNDNLYQFK